MQCESCGDDMVREIVAIDVLVSGRRTSIDQPGWYCWSCQFGLHTASDLAIADVALAELFENADPMS